MIKKFFPPPVIVLITFIVGLAAIVLFRSELKRWLYLQSWPTSLKQIYGAETSNGKEVRCFDERFRATIPIYSHRSHFYTSFDFEQKKIAGKTTIYLSPTGDDAMMDCFLLRLKID